MDHRNALGGQNSLLVFVSKLFCPTDWVMSVPFAFLWLGFFGLVLFVCLFLFWNNPALYIHRKLQKSYISSERLVCLSPSGYISHNYSAISERGIGIGPHVCLVLCPVITCRFVYPPLQSRHRAAPPPPRSSGCRSLPCGVLASNH